MSNNKLIPEIRFPEFKNEGEWEKKVIGDVFTSFSGGTPSTSEREFYSGKIPFIRSAEINRERTELFITEEGLKNSSAKLVDKGDLLVALYGANSGDSAISKINGAINQAILCLQSDYSNAFTYNFLTLKKDWIVSKFIQGGQGNLSGDIVKSITVPFPKKKEQQKIATCLSSLDEVIAAHSQKLDLLKDHKKGLMQNLFPQMSGTGFSGLKDEQDNEKILSIKQSFKSCSDNIPKYRFKEFENDGEWMEKKLGEVANFQKGKGISKADIVENGNLPCIRYGELYTHYKETIDTIKSFTNLSADELVLSEANDVIIPASGETQIDIATASCVLKRGIALGGDLNIIRTEIDGVFLAYYLNSAKKTDIAQLAQGISVVHLYPSQLQTLSISFPQNPQEQQKIATCLSSLDALITAQKEKIEQLKLHKKGLMQGLFPKINDK
ncbi:MAG: restriction endonuclease subunit S [Bacteroidales bacterium]|nr:restriction endonuclease subunit S [Bacteroidales bacterium]